MGIKTLVSFSIVLLFLTSATQLWASPDRDRNKKSQKVVIAQSTDEAELFSAVSQYTQNKGEAALKKILHDTPKFRAKVYDSEGNLVFECDDANCSPSSLPVGAELLVTHGGTNFYIVNL